MKRKRRKPLITEAARPREKAPRGAPLSCAGDVLMEGCPQQRSLMLAGQENNLRIILDPDFFPLEPNDCGSAISICYVPWFPVYLTLQTYSK